MMKMTATIGCHHLLCLINKLIIARKKRPIAKQKKRLPQTVKSVLVVQA